MAINHQLRVVKRHDSKTVLKYPETQMSFDIGVDCALNLSSWLPVVK